MKNQKRIMTALVAVCLCFGLMACGDSTGTQPTQTVGSAEYTLTVSTQGGVPMKGVNVCVYEDDSRQELVWAGKTDRNGTVTFSEMASDSYVAVLTDAPAGYVVAESYPVSAGSARFALAVDPTPLDLSSDVRRLGDGMGDFSVTAPDGTVYTLSELLEQKEAVVLNFFYIGCKPCRQEFPYLQEVYEQYGDRIALLAMNPVDGSDSEIAAFQSDLGLTFPVLGCDPQWASAMGLAAYPTTIVIDRYGTIRRIHGGTLPNAQSFLALFADLLDE